MSVNADELTMKILGIVSLCNDISKDHTKNKGLTHNVFSKKINSFIRAIEKMNDDEIVEMCRNFYSKYYNNVMSETEDWISDDYVTLNIGEGDDGFVFNVGLYRQLCDKSNLTLRKKNLDISVLELLSVYASQRIRPFIENKLKSYKPNPTTSAGPLAAQMGGMPALFDGLKSMMGGEGAPGSASSSNGGDGMKEMMSNILKSDFAKNMTDTLMQNFPEEIRSKFEPVREKMHNEGTLDINSLIKDVVGEIGEEFKKENETNKIEETTDQTVD